MPLLKLQIHRNQQSLEIMKQLMGPWLTLLPWTLTLMNWHRQCQRLNLSLLAYGSDEGGEEGGSVGHDRNVALDKQCCPMVIDHKSEKAEKSPLKLSSSFWIEDWM